MSEEREDTREFFGNSLLGRVLRGEEELEFTGQRQERPKLRETAHMNENGEIALSRSWYDPDGTHAIGDTTLTDRNSAEYAEVMARHPDLGPDKPNTYTEYHDGRWVVTRADEVLASGNAEGRQSA